MKNLITTLLRRRAEKRLHQRKADIAIAIAYSERQISTHRDRIDELYAEQRAVEADLLTLDLSARRTGGALARLGVPCCGGLR